MSGNRFGEIFSVTTAGESHGPQLLAIVDGVPAGLELCAEDFVIDMARRRPGQSALATARDESDAVSILSGVFAGKTLGTPIALCVGNVGQKPSDYEHLEHVYRPGHADFSYQEKYGQRDPRGGGRASARETAMRVAAGVIAKKMLNVMHGIEIRGFVSGVGTLRLEVDPNAFDICCENLANTLALQEIEDDVRCPMPERGRAFVDEIMQAKSRGDSVGGSVCVFARNVPAGWGAPVFDKLKAVLGHAMLSIPACQRVGFGACSGNYTGSTWNDPFIAGERGVRPASNRHGGMLGGISSGLPLIAHVDFHPPSSIALPQQTVDASGTPQRLEIRGRHDPCVVPRAVPIVEAMLAITLADFALRARADRL